MDYYKNLYIGENIKNIENIKSSFKKNRGLYGIYVIFLEENGNNLLTIIHSLEIFKHIYKKKKFLIIGIEKGKKESFLLTKKIIEDFYLSNNNFKLFKNYFLDKKNM